MTDQQHKQLPESLLGKRGEPEALTSTKGFEQPLNFENLPKRRNRDDLDIGAVWTPQEDVRLRGLVDQYGENCWTMIGKELNNRTGIQCMNRWTVYLRPEVKKGTWEKGEDDILIQWVSKNQIGTLERALCC